MRCPICDALATHTTTYNEVHTRRHRYQCNLCGQVFNTYEQLTTMSPEECEKVAENNCKTAKLIYEKKGAYQRE